MGVINGRVGNPKRRNDAPCHNDANEKVKRCETGLIMFRCSGGLPIEERLFSIISIENINTSAATCHGHWLTIIEKGWFQDMRRRAPNEAPKR